MEEPKNFNEKVESLQKKELEFWQSLNKCGYEVDLKLARDLPDDTPDFILRMLSEFEGEASEFCFGEAEGGLVLDAGCGNGNLLIRAILNNKNKNAATRFVGMDFSDNMLKRAVLRTRGDSRAAFLQGCINMLPFQDQSFDWVASSGVLTCLSSCKEASEALGEFNRILKPGGILVVDFFNSTSHFTLLRKHLIRERINPPEYISAPAFRKQLDGAGFRVLTYRGFDFKLCQGYLFTSILRPIADPFFFQEKFSRFLESKVVPRLPVLSLLGYRIYVKCLKK